MKTKKIVALLMCIVIVISAIAALAACKENENEITTLGTTSLNIDNYIWDYDDDDVSVTNANKIKETISIEKMFDCTDEDQVSIQGSFIIIKKYPSTGGTGYKYDVYSTVSNEMFLKDISDTPTVVSSYYCYVLRTQRGSYDSYFYDYYLPDGQQILSNMTTSTVNCTKDNYYINNSKTAESVYVFSATDGYGAEAKEYFTFETKNNVTTYTRLSKSDLSVFSSEYEVGQFPELPLFIQGTDKYPVESDIADYRCNSVGNVMSFYKDGNIVGSLNCSGKKIVGFSDHYLYFYEVKPMASNVESGYNYCGANDTKALYIFCSYDIFTNEITTYNYDIYFSSILPAYNQSTKAFDGAIVTGYKMTDGVYYENEQSTAYQYQHQVIYFTDAQLNVAQDLSDIGDTNVYRLTENRYLVNGTSISGDTVDYLVDKDFKPIYIPGSSHVYFPEHKLVQFYQGGYIGFVDFDGRIVIEPKYTTVNYGEAVFYGDYILLTNIETNQTVSVSKTGEEAPVPSNAQGSGMTTTVTIGAGYYMVREVDAGGNGSCNFYKFGGGFFVKSFSVDSQRLVQLSSDGIIKYTDGTTVSYYKIG